MVTRGVDDRFFPKLAEFEQIEKTVEGSIFEECKKTDRQRTLATYDELFKLQEQAEYRSVVSFDSKVVTTNYDVAMENYRKWKKLNRSDISAFRLDQSEGKFFLDLNQLQNWPSNVRFLKLHGSINYFLRDDGKISLQDSPESLSDEKFLGRLMIYPMQEKYVSREPYSSFFRCFKFWLSESPRIYLAIGYSFRDESINNAFEDALNEYDDAKMIVVNTNPAKVIQRIVTRLKGGNEKLIPVGAEFGTKDAIDGIKNAISSATRA